MQNTHLENVWFKSVLSNSAYIESCRPSYFKSSEYQEAFKIIKSFWIKYSQVPSKNQVREAARLLNIGDKLSDEILDAMWSINLEDYDQEWLVQNTEAWIEWKTLEQSAIDSINYIKSTDVNPDNIKNVINTYKSIVVDRNNLDFAFDTGLDFSDPDAHEQITTQTFSSGYDFIDYCLGGGFSAKCLYVFLGQPKVGKCGLGITKVRNKRTGEIYNIEIKNLYERIKSDQMRNLR